MFYVSLFQLSEDPFNQAHAYPLRLVRGGSSMTWEKGGGSQNHNVVEIGRDLCKSSGSAPLLKQDHLESRLPDSVWDVISPSLIPILTRKVVFTC